MKALDESILMVLFVLLLKRVHFLALLFYVIEGLMWQLCFRLQVIYALRAA